MPLHKNMLLFGKYSNSIFTSLVRDSSMSFFVRRIDCTIINIIRISRELKLS